MSTLNNPSLPPELRSKLEEHTAGGYIFLRTTLEGNVEYYASFDNEASYLSITTKARRILDMMESLDSETLYNRMTGGEDEESFLDNNDDDED